MAFGLMPSRGDKVQLNDNAEKFMFGWTTIRENNFHLHNDPKEWRSRLLNFFHLTLRIYDDGVKWRLAMLLSGKTTSWFKEISVKQRVCKMTIQESDLAPIGSLIEKKTSLVNHWFNHSLWNRPKSRYGIYRYSVHLYRYTR